MSTRHVESGERRRFNGWASAPEFVELRPIDGTAVALKAELVGSRDLRELLFFIQGLSLREGGIKRLAADLIEMFPDRLGTPTMHKIGCKPGKRITPEKSLQIGYELRGRLHDFQADDFVGYPEKTGDELIQNCRMAAQHLDLFLEELCCNPDVNIDCGEKSQWFAQAPYFQDVIGALLEYKRRYEATASAEYVETSIGEIVFEAFDYALETGRSALIEGASGFGKSTALKARCEMNLGRARLLKLTGITNRTTFAQKLSDALGVACGKAFSPARKLIRCEEFLRRTKLMLVIDEGQYLWPQGKRIVSHPELINWLNTACYNEGVPFLISATKQFTVQRQAVERQTDWSSEQSRRRIRRVFPIPDMPMPGEDEKPWHAEAIARMKTDLMKVASAKLGALGLGRVETTYLVGYAISSRGYFQTITDAIEDAELIARRAGREQVTARDLVYVIKEIRTNSDAALVRVYDSKPQKHRRATRQGDSEPLEPIQTGPIRRETKPAETDFSAAPVARGTRPQSVEVLAG